MRPEWAPRANLSFRVIDPFFMRTSYNPICHNNRTQIRTSYEGVTYFLPFATNVTMAGTGGRSILIVVEAGGCPAAKSLTASLILAPRGMFLNSRSREPLADFAGVRTPQGNTVPSGVSAVISKMLRPPEQLAESHT